MVYSSAVAQYVLREDLPLEQRIIDFVDVDSDKWKQFASNKIWPLSAIYKREADKLLEYEQQTAEKFDYNLFVSDSEAELFRQLAPSVAEKVTSYNNGVDSRYFSPTEELENPYRSAVLPIVFTGAMDYWPNVDAVKYFARSVLPQVKLRHPEAEFYIVGNKPSAEVKELEQIPGVVVTGWVEDIRPYIKHASVAVAPMRIARGVQNKVLEAMAMRNQSLFLLRVWKVLKQSKVKRYWLPRSRSVCRTCDRCPRGIAASGFKHSNSGCFVKR